MKGADFGYVKRHKALESLPGHAQALAASPSGVQPCPTELGAQHSEPLQVSGRGVTVQVDMRSALSAMRRPYEAGKLVGVSCSLQQRWDELKDPRDEQCRRLWLLPKPLSQVAIHRRGSNTVSS